MREKQTKPDGPNTPSRRFRPLTFVSSVRGRIIVGFGVMVLILAVLSAGAVALVRQHRDQLREMEGLANSVALFQSVEIDSTSAISNARSYAATGDESLPPVIEEQISSAKANLGEAIENEERLGNQDRADGLRTILRQSSGIETMFDDVIEARRAGDEEALATAMEQIEGLAALSAFFEGPADGAKEDLASVRESSERTADLVVWVLIAAGGMAGLLALAASSLIARSIIKPLSRLETAALAVASGDLEARPPSGGPRELASLGRSLNQMTEALLDASKRRELEQERELAFEELARNEEQFRTLAHASAAVIFRTDAEGNCVYMNDRWLDYTGRPPESALGRGWAQTLHPDDRERVSKTWYAAVAERGIWKNQFRFQRPDGSVTWAEAQAMPEQRDGNLLGYVGTVLDVTEREQAAAALRESEERYRHLVEHAADGILLTDENDRFVEVNPSACRMLGYPREEFLTLAGSDIVDAETIAQAKAAMDESGVITLEAEITRKDGSALPVEVRASILHVDGRMMRISLVRDVSDRRRAEEEMRRLNEELASESAEIEKLNRSLEEKVHQRTKELERANSQLRDRNRELLDTRVQAATDGLTGLLNHRSFQERLRSEVGRAGQAGQPLGLIMLDIDGFKRVNDSEGHLVGDQILRNLADTLESADGTRPFRYGGDEFAVLVPGASRKRTLRVAEWLRRAVADRTNVSERRVTISLGVAAYPAGARSAEELLYGADAAMYWAKSAGKNQVGDWASLLRNRGDGSQPWFISDPAIRTPDAVSALVAALTAKDPTTSAHTDRCSYYSGKLAQALGLNDVETSTVRLASLLHDVGKIAVPDQVLFKAGPLNEDEWAQMKEHPMAALHVLREIRAIHDATPAILHHHEHYDGSGYPDGLTGGEIPLASRILLVTDAFDAMTSDRPYRKALPFEHAVEELKRNAGTQFDPEVVEAFLRIVETERHDHEHRTEKKEVDRTATQK